MCVHLNFSHKKATQALNFFAIQNGGSISKIKALKLLFFADRFHLRKYGQPITNDDYWAMPKGPVPSHAKDIAEMSEFLSKEEKAYAGKFLSFEKPHSVRSNRNQDEMALSESEREALVFTWQTFGHAGNLVDLTHMCPEWKKHEKAFPAKTRVRMDYADFLEDSPRQVECYHLTLEDKEVRLDQLKELSLVESMWS